MKTVKQFKRFNENPSEIAGETIDGNLFHIKYIDGLLIVSIDGSRMFMDYGEVTDSEMSTDMMQHLTREILGW